jgi:hypothetical protein
VSQGEQSQVPFPSYEGVGCAPEQLGVKDVFPQALPKLKSPMSVDYHCAGFCWFAHKQFLYIENTIYGAFGF